jgi:histidinol phosphatase-like PHP family hydrolase
MLPQDLHIHTVYSIGDSAVVKEQTVDMIRKIRHASIIGISDHFEYLVDEMTFRTYEDEVRSAGFKVGIEISGHELVHKAVRTGAEYFVYHCSYEMDYAGLERLVDTGKPVIVAHPLIMGTDLERVPGECYIEINNRYIWRSNWKERLRDYVNERKFVISSDAHQPNWLNQNVARYVCSELGIRESIIFTDAMEESLLMASASMN